MSPSRDLKSRASGARLGLARKFIKLDTFTISNHHNPPQHYPRIHVLRQFTMAFAWKAAGITYAIPALPYWQWLEVGY